MNVLVVEDDNTVREATRGMLERAGFEVTSVENGIAGFAALQQSTFDAIVCDIRLPFLSGQGFFDQVQEDYPHLASKVVFVSGWTQEPGVRETAESTGRPILAKPFTIDQLVTAVLDVIESESATE